MKHTNTLKKLNNSLAIELNLIALKDINKGDSVEYPVEVLDFVRFYNSLEDVKPNTLRGGGE